MVTDGTYTLRKVVQSDDHPEKDTVFLNVGLASFRADHGEYEEGDTVEVKDGSVVGPVTEDS